MVYRDSPFKVMTLLVSLRTRPVVRAYQILNRLLDDPKAYQRDARTIDFWRGVRDGASPRKAA